MLETRLWICIIALLVACIALTVIVYIRAIKGAKLLNAMFTFLAMLMLSNGIYLGFAIYQVNRCIDAEFPEYSCIFTLYIDEEDSLTFDIKDYLEPNKVTLSRLYEDDNLLVNFVGAAYSTFNFDIRDFVKWQLPKLWLDINSWQREPIGESLTADSGAGVLTYTASVKGIEYDTNAVMMLVLLSYSNGKSELDISGSCKVNDSSDKLINAYNRVAWLEDWKLEYSNGESVKGSDLFDYIDFETGLIYVPKEYIANLLERLNKSYSNKGSTYQLRTSTGVNKSVDFKTFGKEVNLEKEKDFILNAMREQVSYTGREPEMSGYGDITDDYIEVSLEDQHIWVYLNNELYSESDIVTGTKGRRDTPTGVYYVTERIPGKYLTGADYKTWVNRWMRLTNSGVGLHDATWRGKFGGSIYTYNGSHGCINLPKAFAYDLYEKIYVGIPVIIY